MDSRYSQATAAQYLDRYARRHGEDLALRVYTSRLLGQEPSLVLSGGGNTSVKSRVTELLGDETDVLYVKGSGWDLASIEPEGFPACRLAHLRRCVERASMTDEQMVRELRGHMLDPASPTPSVEALLHAYLPAKYVDHTHADAVLALVDQRSSAALVDEVFGDGALLVPYVMPGFVLARRVAELWAQRVAEGREPTMMVLDKHGLFTWGHTAQESYERMIDAVTRAERHVERRRTTPRASWPSADRSLAATLAPALRGALTRQSGRALIATFRDTPSLRALCHRDDLHDVATRGPITPDHVLRTKRAPLILPRIDDADREAVRATIERALSEYASRYTASFERCKAARHVERTMLDPFPRVVLVPGLGAFAVGRTRREADVVGELYEHTAAVIDDAEAIGTYEPTTELDLFDVEYWSLEQAKLGKPTAELPLSGKVALVTGGAGGIGLATARALLAAGAHVVVTDRDHARVADATKALEVRFPGRALGLGCDARSDAEVAHAMREAALWFGGLDVVVSNAGAAIQGELHEDAGHAALAESLEINLLAHQTVARHAVAVFLTQRTGGALLFNASKSAFNQGPGFGPYAVAKAALLALMRQYAVDLGAHGVRANAVNADRIRTALFGAGVAEARAHARGLHVDQYFRANLLDRETTADDVARAFVYLATAEATTGCVITVDGGNAAAFPR
jgi:rhamnose utilization protein RhaD (predicted bifunctional aldolase and dehydrogenase)/NAD(P)-dependent dehydrogenase (short-subunit alcohol dehydrogenase family)